MEHFEIRLPASKSISNRVLLLNALSYSPYDPNNLSDCDDTRVMMDVLDSNDRHFDVSGAGTAMRFLTAFLAKTMGEWTLTGSERMKKRPIKVLVDALNAIGGKIEYMGEEGFPPLRIFGSIYFGSNDDSSLYGKRTSSDTDRRYCINRLPLHDPKTDATVWCECAHRFTAY